MSKKKEKPKYHMLGQILTKDYSTMNGVLLSDNDNGMQIRATVLEAQRLYDEGKVDQPPY